MSPLTHMFLIIQLFTYAINGYYLSLNTFEWHNASQFCQSYCNSHLASVHNVNQHRETVELVQSNPYVYKEVWIGLNDIKQSDQWEWTDGTPFDFGFNDLTGSGYVARGTYPWRYNEPDWASPDDCVAIEATGLDQWTDKESWSNYHFLCNSCDSKLNKYIAVIGDKANYVNTGKICEDKFGTSLASIHSDSDMNEAVAACKGLTSTTGCWIGLNDIDIRHDYKWDDGTEFDYGTIFKQYPWYYTQPGTSMNNQYCIQIDPFPEDYTWDDTDCNATARALCNAPSEICEESQWFVAEGMSTDWIWNKRPCSLRNDVMDKETVIIIGEKQFLNGNGILIVDMMFTVNQIGDNDGSAGIVFYFDRNNCLDYYYIGIWPSYSYIFIGKFIDGKWTLLQYASIAKGFIYEFGRYYGLKIELIQTLQSTEWNVMFNNNLILQINDNELMTANNMKSGFIGIRNVNTSLSVKSLFVSGEIEYIYDNSLYLSCNNISTMDPTIYPTKDPTMEPTFKQRPTLFVIPSDDKDNGVNNTVNNNGDGDNDNNDNLIPSFINTTNLRYIWFIGIPVVVLIICFIIAYYLNVKCCKKEEIDYDDSSDDEELEHNEEREAQGIIV